MTCDRLEDYLLAVECQEYMFLRMARESDYKTSLKSGTCWKKNGELESLFGTLEWMASWNASVENVLFFFIFCFLYIYIFFVWVTFSKI